MHIRDSSSFYRELGSVFLPGLAVVLLCWGLTQVCMGQAFLEFNEFVDDTTSSPLTSIEIGPDGRLYAAGLRGEIFRWDLDPVTGQATNQTIVFTTAGNSNTLLQTGIAFDPNSTASNLILWNSYAADAGPGFSGRIDRIDLDSGTSQNFINGLGVAAHQNNDLVFGSDERLYFGSGSLTFGGGIPNNNELAETPLSAAILVADVNSASFTANLNVAPNSGYDPTAPGAPVTVFAEGVRNAFDVVQHSNGFFYSGVNGNDTPNIFVPDDPNTAANEAVLTGRPDETFIRLDPKYYYGHPNTSIGNLIANGGNPTDGMDGDFENTNYPVGTLPDPRFTDAVNSGVIYNLLAAVGSASASPNGLAEYTADTGLQGRILVALFNNTREIGAIELDANGNAIGFDSLTLPGGGELFVGNPLDVTVDPTTGNIFVASFLGKNGNGQVVRLIPTVAPVVPEPAVITVENSMSTVFGSGGTSDSQPSYTLPGFDAGTDTKLVVGFGVESGIPEEFTVTFGGVPLTEIRTSSDQSGSAHSSLFFLDGATGVEDIVVVTGSGDNLGNGPGIFAVAISGAELGFETSGAFGDGKAIAGELTGTLTGVSTGAYVLSVFSDQGQGGNQTVTGDLTDLMQVSDFAGGNSDQIGSAISIVAAGFGNGSDHIIAFNDLGPDTPFNARSNAAFASFAVAATTKTLLGDVNLDKVVTFLDISPFIAILSAGNFQAEADINRDGVVSFLDISPFIGILSGS